MKAHSSAGFTLLEILVVIAILGVVTALVAPAVGRSLDGARYRIEQNSLKNLFARAAAIAYVRDSEVKVTAAGAKLAVTLNGELLHQQQFEHIMLDDSQYLANPHGFWVSAKVRYQKRGSGEWQILQVGESESPGAS